jgi:hypothetical protein
MTAVTPPDCAYSRRSWPIDASAQVVAPGGGRAIVARQRAGRLRGAV